MTKNRDKKHMIRKKQMKEKESIKLKERISKKWLGNIDKQEGDK